MTAHATEGARHSAYIGIALTIAGSIAFSGKPIIIKLAYQYNVDVMTLLALRMLFSLPFFLAMAVWAGRAPTPLTQRDWFAVVALGFVGYYLGSYLDLAGLQYISASLGRLILYLYPTLVLILSAFILKQPVTRRHLLSLALSYGGILLVFRSELALQGPLEQTMLGGFLVFGSAMTYAVYIMADGRRSKAHRRESGIAGRLHRSDFDRCPCPYLSGRAGDLDPVRGRGPRPEWHRISLKPQAVTPTTENTKPGTL